MVKKDKKNAQEKEASIQQPLTLEELKKLSEENNKIKIAKPILGTENNKENCKDTEN